MTGRRRRAPGAAVVLACLALLAAACGAASAGGAIAIERENGRLVVTGAHYRAVISPEEGGRITSFRFDGLEMTRLCPDGRGGMFEEPGSADRPYEVVAERVADGRASVTLSADVGDLKVTKDFLFSADRPWFVVRLTFLNQSPHRLSGASAPAVRHVALPAGPDGSARALYCLNRGAGAEVMTPPLFLARVGCREDAALRWMAATAPAGRRCLGFIVQDGRCRPLPPSRCADDISFGWAYPALGPGETLTARVMVVPLRGFSALSELNAAFAAESLLADGGRAVRLSLTALDDEVRDVSVVTRPYSRAGAELPPCDALVFAALAPMEKRAGQVGPPDPAGDPAWLVHEVYGAGRPLGAFAVPIADDAGAPPLDLRPPGPARRLPAHGADAEQPGDEVPLRPVHVRRGFVMWRLDGAPAREEMRRLNLALTRGETRTTFLGVRALGNLTGLRIALAGASVEADGSEPIPSAAIHLWQLREDLRGEAYLTPLSELAMAPGQTAWLAVTADARQLTPGRYSALLVADGGRDVMQAPVVLHVLDLARPAPSTFGLWHVRMDEQPAPPSDSAVLARWGVTGLTLPVGPAQDPAALAHPGQLGWSPDLLSFSAGGGASSPPFPFSGALMLPCPDPVWLMRADAASPAGVLAAREAGYAPALLCGSLARLSEEQVSAEAGVRFLLVKDGCEPGAAPEMVQSGILDGSESIWLYLDLRQADWRRALTEVPSALWSAAWQGLAGVAVRCVSPSREVDRQPALWHILNDARNDVALWREMRRLATAGQGPQHARRLATLDSIVGTDQHCDLMLRLERGPFKRFYRVAPALGERRLRLSGFERARNETLSLGLRAEPPGGRSGQLYWRGIPLVRDGRANWAVVASDGETAWKKATELQRGLADACGVGAPVSRTFPEGDDERPELIWVVAEQAERPDWPPSVQEAVRRAGGAPLHVARLEDGPTAVVLGDGFDVAALLRTFSPRPHLYAPARGVR